MTSRICYLAVDLENYPDESDATHGVGGRIPVEDESEANLISSRCDDGQHMPVIDLDFAHHYEPSSTPGHGHLYIDQPMPWEKFVAILDALHAAGVIEDGFYRFTMKRGQAFVRKPGVKKGGPMSPVPVATRCAARNWTSGVQCGRKVRRRCPHCGVPFCGTHAHWHKWGGGAEPREGDRPGRSACSPSAVVYG